MKFSKLDYFYMSVAENAAKLSYATRNKVGATIIKDGNILSFGYNGMPSGFHNNCEHLNSEGILETNKEVLHSELNCITKVAKQGISIDNATIYITLSPCINCALLILQSGIKKVVYKEEYRNKDGIEFLKKANIEICQLNLQEVTHE